MLMRARDRMLNKYCERCGDAHHRGHEHACNTQFCYDLQSDARTINKGSRVINIENSLDNGRRVFSARPCAVCFSAMCARTLRVVNQ